MKKRIVSVVALLMALALSATLVACNSGVKPTGTAATPGTVKEDGTAASSGEIAKEVIVATDGSEKKFEWLDVAGANGKPEWRLPAMDLKLKEVTYLCHYDLEQPDPDRPNAARDYYGVTYSTIVVPPEERTNKFVSMVMAGEAPDILICEYMPSIILKGYVQPWDDYMSFDLGLWSDLKASVDNLKYKGHYYTIGVQQGRWDMVWYNKELFEEYGVKTPLEYYKEGNWNWNTFRECAKLLTIDSDMNGTPEIYGADLSSLNAFLYTAGKDFVTINEDGTVTNNIKSPEIARGVQFYVDLNIKDKVVIPPDGKEAFIAGTVAMRLSGASDRGAFEEMTRRGAIFFVPYPRDPQADKYYLPEGFGSSSLGRDCKNPEGAAALNLGALYDIKNTDNIPPLTEEEYYEKFNWSKEMDDWLWAEFYGPDKTPVLSTWITFGINEYWGDIWYRPTQGEPWSSIAEELAPRIDSSIERVMEE